MSGKGTSGLTKSALLALTWTVIQNFYKRKHTRGTSKTKDFKDKKYMLSGGKGIKKETVMADIPKKAKDIIQDRIRQRVRELPDENKEARAENIAGSLISDDSFLGNIGNIFTRAITGISPEPSDADAEDSPDSMDVPISSPSTSEDESELITAEFNKAIKQLKRKIKSSEGKEEAEQLANEFIQGTRGRSLSQDNTLVSLNSIIKRMIEGGYLGNNDEILISLADIGTEFLYNTGRITQEQREERIGQIGFGALPLFAANRNIPQQFTVTFENPMGETVTKKVESKIRRREFETNKQYLKRLQELLRVDLSIYEDTRAENYQRDLINELRIVSNKVRGQGAQQRKRQKEREDRDKLLKESQERAQKQQEQETKKITKTIKKTEKKAIVREEQARGERADIKSNLKILLDQNPILRAQYKNIEKRIDRTKLKEGDDMKLPKEQVNQIVANIPEQYRSVLAPSVRTMLGGNRGLDMNTIASGVLGLTLTSVAGPIAGSVGSSVANYMLNTLNIDLNDYVFAEPETPSIQPEVEEPEMLTPTLEEPERPTPMREVPPLTTPKEIKKITTKTTITEKPKEDQKDIYATGWMPFKQPIGLDASTRELKNWLEFHEKEYMNPSVPTIGGMAQKAVDYYEHRLEEYMRRTGRGIRKPDEKEKEQKQREPRFPTERTDEKKPRTEKEEIEDAEIELFAMDEGKGQSTEYKSWLRSLYETVANLIPETPQVIRNVARRVVDSGLIRTDSHPIMTPGMVDLVDDTYKKVKASTRPTPDVPKRGATVGAVAGAVGSSIGQGGTAQGALGGIIPGAVAGAAATYLTARQLREFYIRRGENPDDPVISKRIKYLTTIPATIAGGMIGYGKTGQTITSGAGITEKKINVDPKVLAETQAQLDQEPSKNKQWIPKAIQPTTAILDQSQQERYADDLEFVAFNYIPPTSEGAQGTINTNPLKRQQYMGDEIRYTNAGVFIPYNTWSQINNTNDITEQRIRELALGQKPLVPLPDLKFIAQDNETTFENMAEYHYVNNENTAIEYQSPYSDFSDVRNYWAINEQSELFTINP